ncbi:hypothetical protein DFH09DRAFT_1154791 [Mycena vulgaris]|nr:hypothetical protein DFH09DRAFT_1154791 [Mycena vulgaris]
MRIPPRRARVVLGYAEHRRVHRLLHPRPFCLLRPLPIPFIALGRSLRGRPSAEGLHHCHRGAWRGCGGAAGGVLCAEMGRPESIPGLDVRSPLTASKRPPSPSSDPLPALLAPGKGGARGSEDERSAAVIPTCYSRGAHARWCCACWGWWRGHWTEITPRAGFHSRRC